MRSDTMRSTAWILGFCVLIVLTEIALSHLADALPPAEAEALRIVDHKDWAAHGPAVDVLFLGDSTAAEDVMPVLFQKETGLSGYNLATHAYINAVSDVSLLQDYLQHHPAPKMVVDIRSLSMPGTEQNTAIAREYFADPLTDRPLLGAFGQWNADTMLRDALIHILPSLRTKYTLLRRLTGKKRPTAATELQALRQAEGYQANTDVVTHPSLDNTLVQELRAHAALPPRPENIALLHTLCALTTAQHIPTIIAIAPYHPLFAATPDLHAYRLQTADTLTQTLTAYPSCQVWKDPETLSGSLFGDMMHLNTTGALLYTHILSRTLQTVH